ncbi:hypothetical protein F5J12DRAFT_784429 [Pisolithus orientalis]|uniref:uncharacterized protein n=1 Tax=Pisolithus orientalis TaxID=936130 RepID=UPI002224AD50|nr:uncharacterized protein F5J12DRAFT_784429 [Pisolithus orientalis]KAI6000113.1 hypothetical protein F5J12DRAFT_784429 [Pisolithus orientalis]
MPQGGVVRWKCWLIEVVLGGQTPFQAIQHAPRRSGQMGTLESLGKMGVQVNVDRGFSSGSMFIGVGWCLLVFVGVHWCSMGFILLYGPVDVQIRLIEVVQGGMNTASSDPACSEEWSDGNIGESGKDGALVLDQCSLVFVDFGGPRGDKHHFKGPACHDGEWSDRIIGCITRHAIDIGESGKDGCPSQCGQGLWFWNSVLRSIAIELGGMNTMSSSPACSKGEWSDGNIRML